MDLIPQVASGFVLVKNEEGVWVSSGTCVAVVFRATWVTSAYCVPDGYEIALVRGGLARRGAPFATD